jgi:predicted nicotinamide N-methyase
MTTISMKVPDDAEPGDFLTFVAQGQEMEIQVPVGSNPGDVLQIQVNNSATSSSGDKQDQDTHRQDNVLTNFDLGQGKILELSSELPADMQEFNDDDDDEETDGTYAVPWSSGIELAKRWNDIFEFLVDDDDDFRPKRILELGSGLGLLGMSFAAKNPKLANSTNNSSSKDTTLIRLTDLPSAMPLLMYNIERNRALLPTTLQLQARPLRWTIEPNTTAINNNASEPPFDCILGSDLLYNVEYIPHLVATVKRHLHPTRGVMILAVRWRKPALEREFFHETGLEWTLLPSTTTSGSCPLSWKDFGDPSNTQSNLYFHQTQISVQGKPKAVADITEDETKQFTTDEFEAWERAHIQIYIGKPPKKPPTISS